MVLKESKSITSTVPFFSPTQRQVDGEEEEEEDESKVKGWSSKGGVLWKIRSRGKGCVVDGGVSDGARRRRSE